VKGTAVVYEDRGEAEDQDVYVVLHAGILPLNLTHLHSDYGVHPPGLRYQVPQYLRENLGCGRVVRSGFRNWSGRQSERPRCLLVIAGGTWTSRDRTGK